MTCIATQRNAMQCNAVKCSEIQRNAMLQALRRKYIVERFCSPWCKNNPNIGTPHRNII